MSEKNIEKNPLKRSENFNKQADECNRSVKEIVDKCNENKDKEKNGD